MSLSLQSMCVFVCVCVCVGLCVSCFDWIFKSATCSLKLFFACGGLKKEKAETDAALFICCRNVFHLDGMFF